MAEIEILFLICVPRKYESDVKEPVFDGSSERFGYGQMGKHF